MVEEYSPRNKLIPGNFPSLPSCYTVFLVQTHTTVRYFDNPNLVTFCPKFIIFFITLIESSNTFINLQI